MLTTVCDVCGKRIREGEPYVEYKEITYSNIDCFSVRNEDVPKHLCNSCRLKCVRALVRDDVIKMFSLFFNK